MKQKNGWMDGWGWVEACARYSEATSIRVKVWLHYAYKVPWSPVRNFDWGGGGQTFSSGILPVTNTAYVHIFS